MVVLNISERRRDLFGALLFFFLAGQCATAAT
jgi:hypothetical protein